MTVRVVPMLLVALAAGGCAVPLKLPRQSPPLADMQEPLALAEEPKDETTRRQLPRGGFTGIYVGDARRSLDDLTGEAQGVLVTKVIENSPGDAAGIVAGDLLLWVSQAGESSPPQPLGWPSEWRQAELSAAPGTTLRLGYDRAGVDRETRLDVVARIHPPGRHAVKSFREEQRVGVVVRTATEVEARRAGLAPGAGAVIVGLSQRSPWRAAGLQFEDLILAVNGREVADPQVLLEAIRDSGETMTIVFVRDGERRTVEAPLSRRETETKEVSIPLLFSYQKDRGVTETSILMGLFGLKKTSAAWRCTLLWIITFTGGDADRLEEVSS